MPDLRTLIAYALMLIGITPAGWRLDYRDTAVLDAAIYSNGGETVLAIGGTHTLVDFLAIPLRHVAGYDDRYVALAEAWGADIVIGHSAGGGLASWVAAEAGAASVTFNAAAPMREALQNDGARQVNVIVAGDRWGDPDARADDTPLPGVTLYLPPAPPGLNSHPMTTVLAILEGARQ